MKHVISHAALLSALCMLSLSACSQGAPASKETAVEVSTAQNTAALEADTAITSTPKTSVKDIEEEIKKGTSILVWEDLMPAGEEELLAELYADFYEDIEVRMREQVTLYEAAKEGNDELTDFIAEGSAADTMEQIGTFNVVGSLDGQKIRIPGYVVPFDFSAKSEYKEFLLVPYFGACLHTPPPPPNQIIYVKTDAPVKIADTFAPVWLEGVMSTGKFNSDLGNSAYELKLSKLEPYEY